MIAATDTENYQPTVYINSEDEDFLIIPDALINYARNTVYNTWQALERQLSQVDPEKEPEMYRALNDRAQTAYNAWMQFRYSTRGA